MTVDDREKTPNFGKQLLNAATVIATPPIKIIGIRGYKRDLYGQHAIFDVYAKDLPKELSRKFDAKRYLMMEFQRQNHSLRVQVT